MILEAVQAVTERLPDIPRWYTGLAEWCAALVYIWLMRPRNINWAWVTKVVLALPALIGLQVFAGSLDLSLWVVGMGLSIAAIFGLIHLTTEGTLKDSGYLTVRAFVLAELIASLEWQLWVHWLAEDPSPKLGTPVYMISLALLLSSYGLGFTLAYAAEKRNFPRAQRLGIEPQPLILALAIGLATFTVSNLSFISTDTPFSGTGGLDIFYIRTLVDLAGFIALYTQQSHRNQMRNSIELNQTRLIMESQHDQYLQSKRNIDELNRMHHDMKYYVAAIRQETSADRRDQYLTDLEDSIRGYESQIETGNHLLDIILSSKMERCLREEISMTNVVDGAALEFMDLMALSALFGNALDNAIEASVKIQDPEQRIIKVSVFSQEEFVMIRFENYWPRQVKFAGGVPQTTKADRARHGFGVLNMTRIVESYGGNISFGVEDDWFTVRILVPRKASS